MPIISTFFGIVIRMFYQEHEPPHFHAEHQVQQAKCNFTVGPCERRGTVATNRDRILESLNACPEGLCDDCLSKKSSVRPRQSARQICLELESEGSVRRNRRVCPGGCSQREKLVSTATAGARSPSQPDAPPLREQITWFSARVYRLARILDALDQSPKGISDKVVGLRFSGALAKEIASIMLTFSTLRNKVVKDLSALEGGKWEVAKSLWDAIESWESSRSATRHRDGA